MFLDVNLTMFRSKTHYYTVDQDKQSYFGLVHMEKYS